MNILLPFALGFVCVAAFYWYALRRVLLDGVRYKIFAQRDVLRRLAVDGKVKPESFAYNHLEKTLCNLIRMAPDLNIYRFGQFMIWRRDFSPRSRDKRFKDAAPAEVVEIQQQAIASLFFVLFINSPIGAIVAALAVGVVSLAAVANSKRKEWLEMYRKRLEDRGAEFLEQDLAGTTAMTPA